MSRGVPRNLLFPEGPLDKVHTPMRGCPGPQFAFFQSLDIFFLTQFEVKGGWKEHLRRKCWGAWGWGQVLCLEVLGGGVSWIPVCSCALCPGIMCTRSDDELESTSGTLSLPPNSVLGLSSALGGPTAFSSGPGTSLHIGAGTRESSQEMRLTDPSALTTSAQRVRASESQAWLKR